MKFRNNSVLAAAVILFAVGATSCSIFKSSSSKDNSGKGLQGWVEDSERDASEESGKIKGATSKDVQAAKKEADKVMAKVDKELREIADVHATGALSGDWAVESVLGKKAVGETAPFIKFVPAEGRVYGNNGCNTLNATYQTSYVDKTISFSNLATTMMLCGQSNITDVEIGQALGMTAKYTVENSENDEESILRFFDANGNQVMELMHRDFHFLDGTWAVEAIDGETVTGVEGMKIALDVDEKHMHGNTGCNIINGEFETDMDAANSISFSKIAMTRMACPFSGWETRMTVALEEAVTAKKISADQIEFLGSNGQQVMLLKRTSPIED